MIPSLLLLSASVVASPVILSEVKATREAGHLRVEVRADGGIDPEAARTRIDQGSLYLFLGGARVKADNRAWKLDDGVGEIRAHRHHTETELDVPLLGNGCAGPVELQGTATGLTALVGCEGAVAAVAVRPAARAAAKEKATTEKPPAVEKTAAAATTEAPALAPKATSPDLQAAPPAPKAPATTTTAAAEAAALKNLVALPPADEDEAGEKAADPKGAAPAPTKELTKDAPAGQSVKGQAATAPAARTEASEGKPVPPSFEAPPSQTEGAKTASVAPSGLRAVGMPALFLAALAIAAYVFARKKRVLGSTRRIQILETASLGQKRSLVIARVGDETLVLGASEAGITLLQSGDGHGAAAKLIVPASAPVEAATPAAKATASIEIDEDQAPNELDQSLVDALADVPEPDGIAPTQARGSFRSIEGGLASLFGRKAAATAAARIEPKAAGNAATFDDLLEDSVEDQELRRKLAAGMSARVR